MLAARNIWDLIVRRADETPDREMAVDESGRRMTFGDYRDRCERAAAGLAGLGVGDGTVVSWVQPTTLEAMVLFGALRRLGAVQNPILPIYHRGGERRDRLRRDVPDGGPLPPLPPVPARRRGPDRRLHA